MSPTRYLWLRRMHLARRALRVADPDDNHCDRDSDELCLLGIGPLRGGLSVAIRRDTLGNAAATARGPAKNFRFALAAS
jgi:hypothetical protein